MNERIYKLAIETGIINEENGYYWIQSVDTLEKFAEMIVRECTDVGSQWAEDLIDTKHYAFVNKKIKQHFGVEE